MDESTRRKTFASVSLFRKYSFVNALHSSLDAFDLCAYLRSMRDSVKASYEGASRPDTEYGTQNTQDMLEMAHDSRGQ